MASESTDEGTVTVRLPAEIDSWLDERAETLDVDRETVLVQLVASYRAAADLDGVLDDSGGLLIGESETLEDAIETEVHAQFSDELPERLKTELRAQVESALADRVEEAADGVQAQLAARMDELEADYTENLEDVRERVVQVKRELEEKAASEHSHEEVERMAAVADAVEDVREDLDEAVAEFETAIDNLEQDVGDTVSDVERIEDDVDTVEEDLEALQERLKTVAWIARDLREAYEQESSLDTVDRIKRVAAQLDVDRAKCENCDSGVDIALMTDPECPHCQATVTDVEPANGFFGKPRLLVASQLEAGEGE